MQADSSKIYQNCEVGVGFLCDEYANCKLYSSSWLLKPADEQMITKMCYNNSMEVDLIARILHTLRTQLAPVDQADSLLDAVEGAHPEARKAAVLLPLYVHNGELSLLFIQRASTLRAHSGEMAFPGGSKDPTDAFPVMTALREAHEEIGLEPARVEVLGLLPPVFTVVSNFVITPVVAYLPGGPGELHLQRSEVTEVVLAPLRKLADPLIARHEQWTREGMTRTVYFYDYGSYCIWGATGRMLNSLLQTLDYNSLNETGLTK